jgi:hypothetical protein
MSSNPFTENDLVNLLSFPPLPEADAFNPLLDFIENSIPKMTASEIIEWVTPRRDDERRLGAIHLLCANDQCEAPLKRLLKLYKKAEGATPLTKLTGIKYYIAAADGEAIEKDATGKTPLSTSIAMKAWGQAEFLLRWRYEGSTPIEDEKAALRQLQDNLESDRENKKFIELLEELTNSDITEELSAHIEAKEWEELKEKLSGRNKFKIATVAEELLEKTLALPPTSNLSLPRDSLVTLSRKQSDYSKMLSLPQTDREWELYPHIINSSSCFTLKELQGDDIEALLSHAFDHIKQDYDAKNIDEMKKKLEFIGRILEAYPSSIKEITNEKYIALYTLAISLNIGRLCDAFSRENVPYELSQLYQRENNSSVVTMRIDQKTSFLTHVRDTAEHFNLSKMGYKPYYDHEIAEQLFEETAKNTEEEKETPLVKILISFANQGWEPAIPTGQTQDQKDAYKKQKWRLLAEVFTASTTAKPMEYTHEDCIEGFESLNTFLNETYDMLSKRKRFPQAEQDCLVREKLTVIGAAFREPELSNNYFEQTDKLVAIRTLALSYGLFDFSKALARAGIPFDPDYLFCKESEANALSRHLSETTITQQEIKRSSDKYATECFVPPEDGFVAFLSTAASAPLRIELSHKNTRALKDLFSNYLSCSAEAIENVKTETLTTDLTSYNLPGFISDLLYGSFHNDKPVRQDSKISPEDINLVFSALEEASKENDEKLKRFHTLEAMRAAHDGKLTEKHFSEPIMVITTIRAVIILECSGFSDEKVKNRMQDWCIPYLKEYWRSQLTTEAPLSEAITVLKEAEIIIDGMRSMLKERGLTSAVNLTGEAFQELEKFRTTTSELTACKNIENIASYLYLFHDAPHEKVLQALLAHFTYKFDSSFIVDLDKEITRLTDKGKSSQDFNDRLKKFYFDCIKSKTKNYINWAKPPRAQEQVLKAFELNTNDINFIREYLKSKEWDTDDEKLELNEIYRLLAQYVYHSKENQFFTDLHKNLYGNKPKRLQGLEKLAKTFKRLAVFEETILCPEKIEAGNKENSLNTFFSELVYDAELGNNVELMHSFLEEAQKIAVDKLPPLDSLDQPVDTPYSSYFTKLTVNINHLLRFCAIELPNMQSSSDKQYCAPHQKEPGIKSELEPLLPLVPSKTEGSTTSSQHSAMTTLFAHSRAQLAKTFFRTLIREKRVETEFSTLLHHAIESNDEEDGVKAEMTFQ